MTGEELCQTTDGKVWARQFMERFRGKTIVNASSDDTTVDEDTIFGWFANAIETGREAGVKWQRENHDVEVVGKDA